MTSYMMDTCLHRKAVDLDGLCARCEDAEHDRLHLTRVDGCFACKVSTIRLQFTYGKEDFHGPTLGERIEEQERVLKEDNVEAEPVGTRWV